MNAFQILKENAGAKNKKTHSKPIQKIFQHIVHVQYSAGCTTDVKKDIYSNDQQDVFICFHMYFRLSAYYL